MNVESTGNDVLTDVSSHVETVCLLINQNVILQHYVNVGIDTEDYYRMKENNDHQER